MKIQSYSYGGYACVEGFLCFFFIIKIVQIQNYPLASTTTKLHVRVFLSFSYGCQTRRGVGLVAKPGCLESGVVAMPMLCEFDMVANPKTRRSDKLARLIL